MFTGVRLRRVICLLLIAACAALPLQAQHYSFRSFGQLEGLGNMVVNTLLIDHTGFLWIGTENGLYRYDGSHFERMGDHDNVDDITNIAEDSRGHLWVGTQAGLFLLRGRHLEEIRLQGKLVPITQQQGLASRGDELLVISGGQLLSFLPDATGEQWEGIDFSARHGAHGDPSANVTGPFLSVFADSHNTVWAGCGRSLCQFSGGTVRIWKAGDGLPADAWESVFLDHAGGRWVRSRNRLFYSASGSMRFEDRTGSVALFSDNRFPLFAEDRGGSVLGLAGGLVIRWNGSRWEPIGANHGLDITETTALAFDKDGSLWIGARGQGLVKWSGYQQIENWTTADGLSSALVWSTARDQQGRMWVASEGGLDSLPPSSRNAERNLVPLLGRLKLASPHIMHVATDAAGKLWVGTVTDQLVWIDPNSLKTARLQMPDRIYQIFAFDDGRVWVTTRAGAFSVYRKAAAIHVDPLSEPLPGSGPLFHLVYDGHRTLWASARSTLLRMSGGSWHRLDPGPARLDPRIDIAVGGDGSIWVDGDFPGVERLRLNGDKIVSAEFIREPTIASSQVVLLDSDRRGWVWIGGDSGLDVFNGTRWARFTQQDGLVWNDIDHRGFLDDPDGSVWISTSGGLSHLLDPKLAFERHLPKVRLMSARLGHVAIPGTGSPRLKWNNAPLTVSFTSLNFMHGAAVYYRYRLNGMDRDWVWTTGESVRYPQLSPGAYRFEVEAIDSEDRTRSAPAGFDFSIAPPWWETNVFYALVAIVLVFLARLLWRWRVRLLLRRQRELEVLVEERTRALRQQATHDGLTGLWNRTAIVEILANELDRASRDGSGFALVLLDFDHFKQINDRHSHMAGDRVLFEAARRFTGSLRPYDSIGRYGGEEFAIVLPGCGDRTCVDRVELLRQTIARTPFLLGESSLNVTCSFGMVLFAGRHATVEQLLSSADAALYRAKAAGRNRVVVAGSESGSSMAGPELERGAEPGMPLTVA